MKVAYQKYIISLCLLFSLSACSYQEYFTLFNETASPITLEYEIEYPATGFGIFDNDLRIYNLTKENEIDWNRLHEALDTDSSRLLIKVTIPPKSAFIFGSLSNDKYVKHTQYFINGRSFNLKQMDFKMINKGFQVTKHSFDDYFKKENGHIALRLK